MIGSCGIICLASSVLLGIILLVVSFSYVEYYEYGLLKYRTGSVSTDRVYTNGRYLTGPGYSFVKYQADAHFLEFHGMSVFSAGASNSSIGLAFDIDVDLTYFLIKDEIGNLHQELATSYRNVIDSRTKDAIKNEAIYISFAQYYQDRKAVEKRFAEAVRRRWKASPALPCYLDQFHLGFIRIAPSVAERQLESRIQNERNDREAYLQEAEIERKKTSVLVNQVALNETRVRRTAEAEASLITTKAWAEAKQLKTDAQTNGTLKLVEAAGIQTQEQRTAFTYIRTLMNRNKVTLNVNYLDPENIIKTTTV